MKILITGVSGFIGFHSALKFLENNNEIIGLDSLNNYYSRELKEERLKILLEHKRFNFKKGKLEDVDFLENIFQENDFEYIIHLGAQAGVRYSLTNPQAYIDSNITGFLNILEMIKSNSERIKHTIFASSSSVYGLNQQDKFSETHHTSHPVSLYAATKRSNELMAHVYSSMHSMPLTGLRFFTVYGPWGRPDMALFKFTKAMLNNKSIELYNSGDMVRDFTYISDIVEGIFRLINEIPSSDKSRVIYPNNSTAPYRIFNIGNGKPVHLLEFLKILEQKLQKKAKIKEAPMQPGDVLKTSADTNNLFQAIGYQPKVEILEGISLFVDWYLNHYKLINLED